MTIHYLSKSVDAQAVNARLDSARHGQIDLARAAKAVAAIAAANAVEVDDLGRFPARGHRRREGRRPCRGHGSRGVGRRGGVRLRDHRGLLHPRRRLRLHRHDLRHAPNQDGLCGAPLGRQPLAPGLPAPGCAGPASPRLLHHRRAGRRRRALLVRRHRAGRGRHRARARRHRHVLRRAGRRHRHHRPSVSRRRWVRPSARGVREGRLYPDPHAGVGDAGHAWHPQRRFRHEGQRPRRSGDAHHPTPTSMPRP